MKTHFQNPLIFLFITVMLVACGEKSASDKQARLDELTAKQKEIADEIHTIESEMGKENPDTINLKAKDVAVEEVKPVKFDHFVRLQGRVEAEDNIDVSAQTMGLVTKVYAKEGQVVSRGQLLAQLDNAIVLKSIAEVKTQMELAKTIYQRQKNLWDQKIGTEVQYLQTKNNLEGLQNRLASLEEQNKMTRIESPISGTVDEVFVKIGQAISPGLPAVRVVNTSDLKAVSSVSEAYVSKIKVGDPVKVRIEDLNKTLMAKVTFVGKTINVLSRTFDVEAKLPGSGSLPPNMTLVMEVIFHSEPDAIVVPINIVQEVNGEKIVYIAEVSGKNLVARKKVVTLDGVFDNRAQVEGLKAGDKIITVGYQGLNDGEAIKI